MYLELDPRNRSRSRWIRSKAVFLLPFPHLLLLNFPLLPSTSFSFPLQSRLELLNLGSFRIDGRRPLEFRSIQLSISPHSSSTCQSSFLQTSSLAHPSQPDGSSTVSHGLTTVKAYVFGPREPKERKNAGSSKQTTQLNVDVGMQPWSGQERRKRAKGDRWVQGRLILFRTMG